MYWIEMYTWNVLGAIYVCPLSSLLDMFCFKMLVGLENPELRQRKFEL